MRLTIVSLLILIPVLGAHAEEQAPAIPQPPPASSDMLVRIAASAEDDNPQVRQARVVEGDDAAPDPDTQLRLEVAEYGELLSIEAAFYSIRAVPVVDDGALPRYRLLAEPKLYTPPPETAAPSPTPVAETSFQQQLAQRLLAPTDPLLVSEPLSSPAPPITDPAGTAPANAPATPGPTPAVPEPAPAAAPAESSSAAAAATQSPPLAHAQAVVLGGHDPVLIEYLGELSVGPATARPQQTSPIKQVVQITAVDGHFALIEGPALWSLTHFHLEQRQPTAP